MVLESCLQHRQLSIGELRTKKSSHKLYLRIFFVSSEAVIVQEISVVNNFRAPHCIEESRYFAAIAIYG